MGAFNQKLSRIIDYIVVYLVIIVSGKPGICNSAQYTIILFSVMLILCIKRNTVTAQRLYKNNVMNITVLLLCLMPILVLQTETFAFSAFFQVALRLFTAMFIVMFLDFEAYKKIYTDLIVFLAIVSLIVFPLSMAVPRIVNYFPVTSWTTSTRCYVDGGLYSWIVTLGYGSGVPQVHMRNTGNFWEPGAYQAFLNLALVYLFEMEEEKNAWKRILLCITILTTLSTTGIITLIVILVIYRRKWLSNQLSEIRLTGLIAIIAIFIGVFYFGDKIFMALEKISYGSDYLSDRVSFDSLVEAYNSSLAFLGLGTKATALNGTNTNSYIYSIISYGVPFTFLLFYMFYKRISNLFKRGRMVFVIIIFLFSSEYLLLFPAFLILAFYQRMSQNPEWVVRK